MIRTNYFYIIRKKNNNKMKIHSNLHNMEKNKKFVQEIYLKYLDNRSSFRSGVVPDDINHSQVTSIVDYFGTFKVVCHIFSLPFPFHCLKWITNNFPSIIFNSVTHLGLSDRVPFKPEFFIRVARSFPLLKYLSVENIRSPFWSFNNYSLVNDHFCSIAEYPHLISLNIDFVNIAYVDLFLNESKTHLPCLTELTVRFDKLKNATVNFTKDATRRNCAKVKRLIVEDLRDFPEEVYRYFPSL